MIRIPKSAQVASAVPHPDHVVEIVKRITAAAGEGQAPDFSLRNVSKHTADVMGNLPHPSAPELTINEYGAYERVAWMLDDVEPTGGDVSHAAQTLKSAGISPSQFEATWSVARPVANRLLGQDPTIIQLQHLKDASPQDIHNYYLSHPFPGFEEVTAGQMATYYRAAEAIARQYGRTPNHVEVSRFAVAGYDSEAMHAHYGDTSNG